MGHATGKAVSLEQEIEHLLQAHSRQMESEAAQQKYYELLLDHVDTGVVSCEADGTIRWMNHAAERHIGMLRQVPEQWNAMASGAAAVVPFERHGATKDFLLSVTWFSLNGRPQRLFTLRDIRHVLEQQEIASWKTLTRVLTHEIMNSISPILSLTETLTTAGYDRPGQEEVSDMQQALKVIHRRSRGLLDFVENYRKLTRLPAPQYTDIRADELFSDLQRLFGDPRLVVDQPYPDFTFRADRGQVEQLLINLLKNARDASSATDRKSAFRCAATPTRCSSVCRTTAPAFPRSARARLCPVLYHEARWLGHRAEPVQANRLSPPRPPLPSLRRGQGQLLHPLPATQRLNIRPARKAVPDTKKT